MTLILSSLMNLMNNSWIVSFFTSFLMVFVYFFSMNQNFSWSMEFVFNNSPMNNLLVFLSLILCALSLVSTPENKKSQYLLCISSLLVILMITFSVENAMIFYIFFEASLIPTLLLIISWGYQPERLQAGLYMMIYTVIASLPLLVLMIFRCKTEGTMMFSFFTMSNYKANLVFIISLAFLVKLPMYTLHLWLPKAHVEASLAGSMILAGILLKLGGFGLYQMGKMFNLTGSMNNTSVFIMSLAFVGGFLSSLVCMRQKDMKAFVAYSSVSHMSLVVVGIFYDKVWGVISSLITMFAHGLSSSALFCMTYYTYNKVHSRSMVYMKGMLQMFPTISLFWFIYCAINMAVPPTLNLLGEMFVVPVMYLLSNFFMVVMGFMIFISAVYNMYLYSLINHGPSSNYILMSYPLKNFQMISLLFHFLPLLLLLKLEFFFILTEFC